MHRPCDSSDKRSSRTWSLCIWSCNEFSATCLYYLEFMLGLPLLALLVSLQVSNMHAGYQQVYFVPSFTDEQRTLLLAACTAVLYTPENEHFGIVPLEAMSAARPVIACNSGGPKESIIHKKTGYLCAPNAKDFAAAMKHLLVRISASRTNSEFAHLLHSFWHLYPMCVRTSGMLLSCIACLCQALYFVSGCVWLILLQPSR